MRAKPSHVGWFICLASDSDGVAAWSKEEPQDETDERQEQNQQCPDDFGTSAGAAAPCFDEGVDVEDEDDKSEKTIFHFVSPSEMLQGSNSSGLDFVPIFFIHHFVKGE